MISFPSKLIVLEVCILGSLSLLLAQEAMLFRVSEVNVAMVALEVPEVITSLTSCAIRCHMLAGSWIVPSNGTSSLQPSEGLFTTGAFCNTSLNFTLETNGTASVCIWMSTKNYNYTTSVNSCLARRMHLYTPKTLDKFSIMTSIVIKLQKNFWIGLDDIEVENVFRWVDDGSLLYNNYRKQIFAPNQPDNHNGSEDCVAYNLKYFPLNDGPCSSALPYICEKGTTESTF
ncbi:CD209 antigen-like protein 2 [Biomphalaria pfeifferi]|uniref:CD209 antigen-like protein 2 n=1 Tax=Biomphalaria pfeifferi TaxID=112525 RepID=A0AAD8B8D2_BIOPF|nr:CD209 antigen-like protein 2 [Biomphalaria pfeifferi]